MSSPLISFFLSTFTTIKYIFIVYTCIITIMTFQPCAWNVEFQHFILILIKFPYFADTINLKLKEGFGGQKRSKNKVTLRIFLRIPRWNPQPILWNTIIPFQVWHKLLFFKCQNFRKLRSLPIDFLKNYCLLKPKFHRILEIFIIFFFIIKRPLTSFIRHLLWAWQCNLVENYDVLSQGF
jgi:hypothetical protein